MSEPSDTPASGTFMHAFLPGLILGLVVGAVAGALLPDLLGGSNIPTPDGSAVETAPGERDGRAAGRDDLPIEEGTPDPDAADPDEAADAPAEAPGTLPDAP